MLVPIHWLNKYVTVESIDIKELKDQLIMSGSNTEAITNFGDNFSKVVVGKILEITEHPNADKLLLMNVDVGEEVIQIVTGALNCSVGDLVPVALDGATIAGGKAINKGELRGEISEGMLCSLDELGFDKKVIPQKYLNGIYILNGDYTIGSNFKTAAHLDDHVIDFEITPNRPDCLSILGMARETKATFDMSMTAPNLNISTETEDINDYIDITIEDPDLCPRYTAKVIKNVEIKESPTWMQIALMKAGVRPKNNIVDITNYVMLEFGQPIHAFDLDTLSGNKIVIRRATSEETIVTLDKTTRTLDNETLVIADDSRPVALAGIMGGQDTEVRDHTQNILLEIANFDETNIRQSSKKYGLRSEASSRYEKGISPSITKDTAQRLCHLIEKLDAGQVIEGTVDVYPKEVQKDEIVVRPARVNKLLGTTITTDEMIDYLSRLEIPVRLDGDNLVVKSPDFRLDINKEIDLVEEIARIYGYNNIERTIPKGNNWGGRTPKQKIENYTKKILLANGVSEITTYSFISSSTLDQLRIPDESELRKYVEIKNPLGEEFSMMRTNLIANMIEVLKRNYNRDIETVRLFEKGSIFIPKELPVINEPIENKRLVIGTYGEDEDFFTLKGTVENLLEKLGLIDYTIQPVSDDPTYHPGRCGMIKYQGKAIGKLGEIHPKTIENFDLDARFLIADIDYEQVLSLTDMDKKFESIPKYPAINRDIALLVTQEIAHQQIIDIINEKGGALLEEVKLFDVYEGEQIEAGYKSVAYNLAFRSKARTLKEAEVNEKMDQILDALREEVNAKLR